VLQRAVRVALARLERADPGPFEFSPRVVESATVNAFALPGGPIVVYTGLLREAESAEQLAGVLAHEMAHVTRRHGMQRIAQSLGVVAAVQLLFGDVSGVMAVAVEVLREGAINSYSREQEHEADMDGVERLRWAGLDPRALADFFELLAKKEGQLPSVMRWLGTHPDLAQRVKDVRARAGRGGAVAREPLNIDWPEVQLRAAKP
jgi:predicted Zn-dependent protease